MSFITEVIMRLDEIPKLHYGFFTQEEVKYLDNVKLLLCDNKYESSDKIELVDALIQAYERKLRDDIACSHDRREDE
jgi:hypothetical protein